MPIVYATTEMGQIYIYKFYGIRARTRAERSQLFVAIVVVELIS